jgi:hypothetical protein
MELILYTLFGTIIWYLFLSILNRKLVWGLQPGFLPDEYVGLRAILLSLGLILILFCGVAGIMLNGNAGIDTILLVYALLIAFPFGFIANFFITKYTKDFFPILICTMMLAVYISSFLVGKF